MIEDYKKIRKIGEGGEGVVYLVKNKNKKYVLKIEKILEKNIKKNLGSKFWRENEFIETMNNLYPKLFMNLYEYDIIEDDKFKLPNPYNLKNINELNESKFTSRKIFEFVDTTLNKIINKLTLDKLYSILVQLSYIIYIMNKNGYTHNDLHNSNIGIIYTKRKYLHIFDYSIPTYGYIVKLIDYGRVLHKKYKNYTEEIIYNINIKEEYKRLLDIVVEIPFYNNIPTNFWKTYDYDKQLDKFMNSDELILVDNLVKNKNGKFNLFEVLYPMKFQKQMLGKKFTVVVDNIIRVPIEDYIFLLNTDNINDILKYFIMKI